MGFSRNYTLADLKQIALEEFGIQSFQDSDFTPDELTELINRAVSSAFGRVYALNRKTYDKRVVLGYDTAGKYADTGTFTLSTTRITATLNISFMEWDVEKLIGFRYNGVNYLAFIDSYVSATTVVVRGNFLPEESATITNINVYSINPNNATVSLANLRLHLEACEEPDALCLESSVTDFTEETPKGTVWNASAPSNSDRIVFDRVGLKLYLTKGDSLSSYGACYLTYPSLPNTLSSDTDALDVPDGITAQVVLAELRVLMAQRVSVGRVEEFSQKRDALLARVGDKQ